MKYFSKLSVLCLVLFSVSSFANEDTEKLFIKNSINDLKQWAISAKKSNFVGDTYSVKEIYSDYTNNELAANKKYKGNPIRIKATVSKIKEDAFSNAFIVSEIGEMTLGQAYFKVDEKDERILALSKNDNVDLMCKFDEFTLDSLNFNDCLFTDQYLDNLFVNSIIKRLQTEDSYKPKSRVEYGIYKVKSSIPTELLEKACQDQKHCSMQQVINSTALTKQEKKQIEQHLENSLKAPDDESLKSLPRFPN